MANYDHLFIEIIIQYVSLKKGENYFICSYKKHMQVNKDIIKHI